jgi:hypothetical protein
VNIAIVTETFPPEVNGVAMTFGVIARELSRHGHAVTVHRPPRPMWGNECGARSAAGAVRQTGREWMLQLHPIAHRRSTGFSL